MRTEHHIYTSSHLVGIVYFMTLSPYCTYLEMYSNTSLNNCPLNILRAFGSPSASPTVISETLPNRLKNNY